MFPQNTQQKKATLDLTDVARTVIYEKGQHESEIYEFSTCKKGREISA